MMIRSMNYARLTSGTTTGTEVFTTGYCNKLMFCELIIKYHISRLCYYKSTAIAVYEDTISL